MGASQPHIPPFSTPPLSNRSGIPLSLTFFGHHSVHFDPESLFLYLYLYLECCMQYA